MNIDAQQLVILILIGGVAGWLAGLMLKGRGLGLVGNVIVGVVGAFLGTWLFNLAGVRIDEPWVATLIASLVGSLILLFGAGLIAKK